MNPRADTNTLATRHIQRSRTSGTKSLGLDPRNSFMAPARNSLAALLATTLLTTALLAACGGGSAGGGGTGGSSGTGGAGGTGGTGGSGGGGGSTGSATYNIGGTVAGLTGSGLAVTDNAGDALKIPANGAFTFANALATGASYQVAVTAQPTNPSQTCSVAGGAGTVGGTDVTGVTITCTTNSFAVGGTATGVSGTGLVLQNSGAGNLAVGADGTFAFAAPVTSGGTYAVSILAQPVNPVQVCTIDNGQGTVSAGNIVNIAINCVTRHARFAYVANGSDGTISTYAVDDASGQLRSRGYIVAGSTLLSVGVDPASKFVYATDGGSGVLAYTANAHTGALTPVLGSPFTAGTTPFSVTVDPSGRFVYVANNASANISAYTIEASSGALTAVGGSPFATGFYPYGVSVTPDGRFAYVPSSALNTILFYGIDPTNGALVTPKNNSVPVGTSPVAATIAPGGKFIYVTNYSSNNISAFAIDATSGGLTPVAGSPFSVGSHPMSFTIDASGGHAYVANTGANTLSAYTIDATGALKPIGTAIATSGPPCAMRLDPNGKFAYVTSGSITTSSLVSTYNIDPGTGALTALSSVLARSPVSVSSALAMTQGTAPVTFNPKFAYTANLTSGDVSAYAVNATTGVFTPAPGSPLKVGAGTVAVAVDPSGQFAYVTNNGTSATDPPTLRAYTIDSSTGALTFVNGSAIATGAAPLAIGIEPSGRFVYVTSAGSLNILGYAINPKTGALTALADNPFTAEVAPNAIAFDPSGKFAYVTNGTSNSVTVFTISITGSLKQVIGGNFIVGTGPSSITISPSGQFAFVGYQTPSPTAVVGVSAFAIDGYTGGFTPVAGSPFTLGITLPSLSIHPSGRFLYGAGYTSNSIAAASVSTTGVLSPVAGSPLTALTLPSAISTDPSGKFVYATSAVPSSNSIFAYTLDTSTGAISPVSGSPFTFGGMGPVSLAVWGTPQ